MTIVENFDTLIKLAKKHFRTVLFVSVVGDALTGCGYLVNRSRLNEQQAEIDALRAAISSSQAPAAGVRQ